MANRMATMRVLRPILLFLIVFGAGLTARARAEEWYQPTPADFRGVYDRDDSNRRCESWTGADGYWAWVQTFYGGYTKHVFGFCVFHQAGWTASGHQLEAHLATDAARERLRHALNALGREIAGEWAKDDSHSRIDSSDLKHWGESFRQAAGQEDGSGQALQAAVSRVQSEVTLRLSASR